MARRIILDTGVLISVERGTLDVDAVLGADDAAIAAITAMELLVGVERADENHRAARAIHVESLLSSLAIETYDLTVARIHARLAVEAMTKGKPRSAYDMMIAPPLPQRTGFCSLPTLAPVSASSATYALKWLAHHETQP